MPGVLRWKFEDPFLSEEYQFANNPLEMSSIHGPKTVTVRKTTAVGGQALLFEGNTEAHEWTFGGPILSRAHYAALELWSKKRHRIRVTDHFGRQFWVYLIHFDAQPENRRGRRWFHRYTMRAVILSTPTNPTVVTD